MLFKILWIVLPSVLLSLPGYHLPWGKDADLKYEVSSRSSENLNQLSSLLAQAMGRVIVFHQNIISPIDGPRSHFKPSSSSYMLQAMTKHGFLKGYLMGCDRLLRENSDPWFYRTILFQDQIWKIDFPPD